jgi:magnesium chelatase subunit D
MKIESDSPYRVREIASPLFDELSRKKSGRRSTTRSDTGRYVGSEMPQGRVIDLAFDATLRAAAPYQRSRKASSKRKTALHIEKHDLRQKVREKKSGNLIMFVLDSSGSMEREIASTKAAIVSLLLDAYQRRDHIGLVNFWTGGADLVLPPTKSVELAQRKLPNLYFGGRSPLTHGLALGLEVIKDQVQRHRELIPMLVLISDGKGNVSMNGGKPEEEAKSVAREIRKAGIRAICIDTEKREVTGLMADLCREMGGLYLRPEDLKADSISTVVKSRLRHRR